MYKGKYSNRKKRRLAPWAALALALVLTLSVGGTIAYLITGTDSVENTFTPAEVSIVIHENGTDGKGAFDHKEKTNVYVENTSQADVYIRAAIVINWQDDKGNVVAEPLSENDYTMKLGTGWTSKNGYYYCTAADTQDETKTSQLIVSCAPNGTPKYHLSVSVLAQAIQAEPNTAVTDAWGDNLPELAVIKAGN